jgi:S-DNA-T family DNA segregation ATPase FtsK/SpoIIIE
MKEIINSDKFQHTKFDLPIGLGKTISNEPFVVDLAKMPHLLIAGATGQGKSVGLNAIITSLLYKKHPSEMKIVLIDPKKVEFTLYSILEKHYLAKLPDVDDPIISDTKQVVQTLNSLCVEMYARLELLKSAKTRNIKEYNLKFCTRKLSPALGHRYLPYIVMIIDEFADLIMTAGRDVEVPIARLAQLARAIGIHLIIATQRPSVNIITGTIKANFPARLAYRVVQKIDSRTILDSNGADRLIGKGDMLLSTGSDLIRLQCAFVDTPEVESIAQFIEEQQSYPEPFLLPEYVMEEKGKGGEDELVDAGEIDQMFMDAAALMVQTQLGSTSLIQRKMKLGYNRAGRVMDQLEEFGIVGPAMGSKAREVKVKTNEELMLIFKRMGLY